MIKIKMMAVIQSYVFSRPEKTAIFTVTQLALFLGADHEVPDSKLQDESVWGRIVQKVCLEKQKKRKVLRPCYPIFGSSNHS